MVSHSSPKVVRFVILFFLLTATAWPLDLNLSGPKQTNDSIALVYQYADFNIYTDTLRGQVWTWRFKDSPLWQGLDSIFIRFFPHDYIPNSGRILILKTPFAGLDTVIEIQAITSIFRTMHARIPRCSLVCVYQDSFKTDTTCYTGCTYRDSISVNTLVLHDTALIAIDFNKPPLGVIDSLTLTDSFGICRASITLADLEGDSVGWRLNAFQDGRFASDTDTSWHAVTRYSILQQNANGTHYIIEWNYAEICRSFVRHSGPAFSLDIWDRDTVYGQLDTMPLLTVHPLVEDGYQVNIAVRIPHSDTVLIVAGETYPGTKTALYKINLPTLRRVDSWPLNTQVRKLVINPLNPSRAAILTDRDTLHLLDLNRHSIERTIKIPLDLYDGFISMEYDNFGRLYLGHGNGWHPYRLNTDLSEIRVDSTLQGSIVQSSRSSNVMRVSENISPGKETFYMMSQTGARRLFFTTNYAIEPWQDIIDSFFLFGYNSLSKFNGIFFEPKKTMPFTGPVAVSPAHNLLVDRFQNICTYQVQKDSISLGKNPLHVETTLEPAAEFWGFINEQGDAYYGLSGKMLHRIQLLNPDLDTNHTFIRSGFHGRSSDSQILASPNPFNPSLNVRLPDAANGCTIHIMDIRGVSVFRRTLGGLTQFQWTAIDGAGKPLRSGIYFIRVQAPGQKSLVKRVVLQK